MGRLHAPLLLIEMFEQALALCDDVGAIVPRVGFPVHVRLEVFVRVNVLHSTTAQLFGRTDSKQIPMRATLPARTANYRGWCTCFHASVNVP